MCKHAGWGNCAVQQYLPPLLIRGVMGYRDSTGQQWINKQVWALLPLPHWEMRKVREELNREKPRSIDGRPGRRAYFQPSAPRERAG